MSYPKLYINDTLMTLPGDNALNISLQKNFFDAQKLDTSFGSFSYSIRLAKNDITNKTFGHSNVENTIDKFVLPEEYVARLETRGNNSLIGVAKLNSIGNDFYEIFLIGNDISWASAIDGKNLNELTNFDGTPWTFDYVGSSGSTTTNSLSYLINNATYENSDVAFPLVPRGYFYHSGATFSLDYFYDDSLSLYDIPPAVFELKIVKKIFENIGWGVDSDLFYESEHKNLVLPFTSGDYYKINLKLLFGAEASGNTIQAGIYPTNDQFASEVFPEIGTVNGVFKSGTKYDFLHYKDNNTSQTRRCWFKEIGTPYYSNNGFNTLENWQFVRNTFNYNVTSQNGISTSWKCPVTDKVNIDIDIQIHEDDGNGTGMTRNCTFSDYQVGYPLFSLPKSGFYIYISQDPATDEEIRENITDYIYSTNPLAVIDHPLVLYYFDVFQTAIYQTVTAFQPYLDIYSTNATANASWSNLIALNPFFSPLISGGNIHVELREVEIGSTEKIKMAWVQPGYTDEVLNSQFNLDYAKWKFFASSAHTTNGVNISENLPPLSQKDFLKDWMNRNKLFISYNESNHTVRFDTAQAYFLPNEMAVDLTNDLDDNYAEPATTPMNLPRNIYFKYTNDNSDYLINQDMDYASYQITSDNIYTKGDQTIDTFYSATRTKKYFYSGITVELPTIATESDFQQTIASAITWTFNATPRLLKLDGYAKDLNGNDIIIKVDGYDCKILKSRFEDDRGPEYLNLRFDQENGLVQKYYLRYLNEISDSHILKLNSKISSAKYNLLYGNVPVKFRGGIYYLGKVDGFKPAGNATCKIELIKKFTN